MQRKLQRRGFTIGFAITIAYLFTAFLALHFHWAAYGTASFIVAPAMLGLCYGLFRPNGRYYAGLVVGLLLFLITLLIFGWEGTACILMALPILAVSFGIGKFIGFLIRTIAKWSEEDDPTLQLALWPFMMLMAAVPIERLLTDYQPLPHEVSTEMVLPYTAMEVYETIKSVDTLEAPLSPLMYLNLPVPRKCVLEKEAVGGLRTCYFDGGTITERITQLQPGAVLRMDVVDYKLTGRKWLGFKEAIYFFEDLGPRQSKITRITTYTSVLRPVFYWQPLEEIGISQEHDYVFANLKKDLAMRFGQR